MHEQIQKIKSKISQLHNQYINHKHLPFMEHGYALNPVLSHMEVASFEQKYQIHLPEEYVLFMTEIGNGGLGPAYGLEPFENILFADLHTQHPGDLIDPGKPFPHTRAWNISFEPTVELDDDPELYDDQYLEFEEKYFETSWLNGTISICNIGGGISELLVVNGPAYGTIWTNDRSNDNGIYPSTAGKIHLNFLNWYENWLDSCLHQK